MTEGQVPQDSRAILIGTSRYEHDGLDPIPAVVANVNDLAEVLTGSGGAFTTEHCISIIDPSRTADVGHAVGRAAQEATGVLLVYYTGHGLLDRKGRLHLTLTGSAPDRIRWTTVPFETLREEILDSPARVRILILDCCFAGRAFEAMTDLPGLVAGQTELRGTYTIASSAANEPSFAPTGHRNTAFTGALLNAAAAAPGSTLNDLYHEAEQHLRRDGHPRPQSRSIDVAGEVRLFGELGPEHRFLRAAEAGEPVAMTNLGQLLEQRGQLDEAEAWYRRAADAGEPVAMTNLGQLLEQRGQLDEAEAWFRRAADAGEPVAMTNLGHLLEQHGKLAMAESKAEAEAWYRRAADAGEPVAMTNLGDLFEQRGELDEAEAWFRRAADVGEPYAMTNLGYLLELRGKLDEGEAWYRRAADAGEPIAMTNLGELFVRRGELDEAEAWFRRAAGASEPYAMNNLGDLFEQRGELDEAETWFRRAADTNDRFSSIAMNNLGHLLRRRGKRDEAETWFQRAADTLHGVRSAQN